MQAEHVHSHSVVRSATFPLFSSTGLFMPSEAQAHLLEDLLLPQSNSEWDQWLCTYCSVIEPYKFRLTLRFGAICQIYFFSKEYLSKINIFEEILLILFINTSGSFKGPLESWKQTFLSTITIATTYLCGSGLLWYFATLTNHRNKLTPAADTGM